MRLKILKSIALTTIFTIVTTVMSNVPAVEAVENETKLIALTFDDGPNTTTTNEVLDVLEKYNAKASFFLIGTNINDESADAVKRAYDMGCEIDNHSKTHSNMGGMASELIKDEVSFVDEKVMDIIGEPTKFFRPPFIDVSQTMYDSIDIPFICGIDCKDYMENVTAQERSDYIINNAKDGVIVLLHDAAGNSQTVEAIKTVIPTLQEQGYEFVTLTELFERQGEVPKGNMIYSQVAKYPCKDYKFNSNIFTGEAIGDSSWSGWSNTAVLDAETLKSLGDSYAIEVECSSSYSPVIALQKWSGSQPIWSTVEPFYFNGDKACFLASDIIEVLNSLEIDYTDLDRMTIAPSGGTMTMTKVDLLVKGNYTEKVKGDINADNEFNISDIVMMQKWLLAMPDAELTDWEAGDLCQDNTIDVYDLICMRKLIAKK